jgi:hypothetical protein
MDSSELNEYQPEMTLPHLTSVCQAPAFKPRLYGLAERVEVGGEPSNVGAEPVELCVHILANKDTSRSEVGKHFFQRYDLLLG